MERAARTRTPNRDLAGRCRHPPRLIDELMGHSGGRRGGGADGSPMGRVYRETTPAMLARVTSVLDDWISRAERIAKDLLRSAGRPVEVWAGSDTTVTGRPASPSIRGGAGAVTGMLRGPRWGRSWAVNDRNDTDNHEHHLPSSANLFRQACQARATCRFAPAPEAVRVRTGPAMDSEAQ